MLFAWDRHVLKHSNRQKRSICIFKRNRALGMNVGRVYFLKQGKSCVILFTSKDKSLNINGFDRRRTQTTHNTQGRVHITRDTWMGETRTQLTHFRRPSFSEPPPSAQQQQQQQQHADSQPTGEHSFPLPVKWLIWHWGTGGTYGIWTSKPLVTMNMLTAMAGSRHAVQNS